MSFLTRARRLIELQIKYKIKPRKMRQCASVLKTYRAKTSSELIADYADIQTPKLVSAYMKAHQAVLQFNSSDADNSAASILVDNQCADASTSGSQVPEDVCGLPCYKPLSTHNKRETSLIENESYQNAKNDGLEELAKKISLPEETKERSAENLPDKDLIPLDLQESLSLKNTEESTQFIQARAVVSRPRTRPVKYRWKIRPKFRARTPPRKVPSRPSTKSWLPFKSNALPKTGTTRKVPNRPPSKTWLPSKTIALPKTSTTRKVETARKFRRPPNKTRRKSFLWRPKTGNEKKSSLNSPRNRPNRSLGPHGRIEKPRKTTSSRRVFKSTKPLGIRRKNKIRKKPHPKKVDQTVPDSIKPVQGASSSLHVVPSVIAQPNGGQRNPTSSDHPPNASPPNLNHAPPPPHTNPGTPPQPDAIPRNSALSNDPPSAPPPNLNHTPPPPHTHPGAPPQPDAIPRNSALSNDPPNAPLSNLNPTSLPSPQTAPPLPPQPNRMQESSNHNGGQDPPASASNNQISSHHEQDDAQSLVNSQDSRDLELIQQQNEQELNQIQPTRRRRTSRSRPTRSRAIQNHRSAVHRSPSHDEQSMEDEYLEEEGEESEGIAREMPGNRAPSNKPSKLFHMSDLVFSTINSAIPHLLGNSEMRRTRNPDMEDMGHSMMGREDDPGEMRGSPDDDNLLGNQGGPDMDLNEGMRDPRALGPQGMQPDSSRFMPDFPMDGPRPGKNIRPQSDIRSRPKIPPSDDIEQESFEENIDEPSPEPRLTRTSPNSRNTNELPKTKLASKSHSDVDDQKTENLSSIRAPNRLNGESDSNKDNKFAKDDDDDDDDNLENTYDEQDDENSEDSSEADSEADPEPGHDIRNKFNSNSNRDSKHKADSEPHHDNSNDMHIEEISNVDREIHHNPLNGTHIEGISNSTHEIKNTTHLEAHSDMSTDIHPKFNAENNHEALEKPSTDAHTEKNPIANQETNADNISDNKLISNGENPANTTRDSLSEAMDIDIEEGINSTSTSDSKSINNDRLSSKINATEVSHGNTSHNIDSKEGLGP
ncbi:putative Bgh-specific protein [Blumeria hordei DH14]|uniref:Putative Bgh-specific protein n=1 Tax=Blumeria graminis f. sp. hordei (strain DH14) TaxID=546991 RepID=N1J566_BLUG1|nr:putative Bgh-specific protein [Blumeria hordei DH14]